MKMDRPRPLVINDHFHSLLGFLADFQDPHRERVRGFRPAGNPYYTTIIPIE